MNVRDYLIATQLAIEQHPPHAGKKLAYRPHISDNHHFVCGCGQELAITAVEVATRKEANAS